MATGIEITPASGITIGTTPITSGTDNRILYQSGGVVQQSERLTFDGTNFIAASSPYAKFVFTKDVNDAPIAKITTSNNDTAGLYSDYDISSLYTGALRLFNYSGALQTNIKAVGTSYLAHSSSMLSIGASTAGARLDVRAQGALSTDIAFRVRNSADTENLLIATGNGSFNAGLNYSTSPFLSLNPSGSTRATLRGGSTVSIELNNAGWNNLNGGSGGWDIEATGGEIRQRNGSNYTLLSGNYFGIGRTPSARLDVQSQGALSTDIALRVRNSADTFNIMSVAGNGDFEFNSMSNTSPSFKFRNLEGGVQRDLFVFTSGGTNSVPSPVTFSNPFSGGGVGLNIFNNAAGVDQMYLQINRNNFSFGAATIATATTDRRVVYINNGTAPSSSVTDGFKMYSADIVAGNAAPHFITEAGDIIKLFKGTALTAPDGTLANAVTRIAELEARLQAHGLIA